MSLDVVYLAASFSRQAELRGYRDDLAKLGVTCSSHWLTETVSDDQVPLLTDDYRRMVAEVDLTDIERSDLVISFTGGGGRPSGGRHVELGFALALGINCWVVGPRENVFHYSHRVKVFETWAQALACL